MSYMDNCTSCEEKDTTIEHMQTQLDDIRKLIENDAGHNSNNPISVRYHDLYEVVDEIVGILER